MTRNTDGITMERSRKDRFAALPRWPKADPRRSRLARTVLAGVALVVAVHVTHGPARADTHGRARLEPIVLTAGNGSFQATIRGQAETVGEPVVMPIGTTTMIDVNVPVERALVGHEEVVQVTVLSPRQIMLTARGLGRSVVILADEAGEQVAFEVLVQPDLSGLREAIRRTVPSARVELTTAGQSVVIDGVVGSSEDAAKVLGIAGAMTTDVQSHMRVAGEQQVLLRCTVAEVSRRATRELGVDMWMSFESNAPRITARQLTGINPVLLNPTLIQPVAISPLAQGNVLFGNRFLFGSDAGGFQAAISSQSLQMELFVRALQENLLLRILAEPNLVAMSGEEASFLAGGEIPVPVPQAVAGGQTITIEWREFGVILQFIPTVTGRQGVRLQVCAEVSELDFTNALQLQGTLVPAISQRRVNTTIELAGGSTIAIAGLLSESTRGVASKIPGLGDVPVLGALFRSVEYQRDQTELVVLVTPELVRGMDPDQIAQVPGATISHPNDWQFYGLGMIEGDPEPATDPAVGDRSLHTDPAPRYRKYTDSPEQTTLHGPWGPAEADEMMEH